MLVLSSFVSTGVTEEHVTGCLNQQTTWTVILYTEHRSSHRCVNNRMTEKYQGCKQNNLKLTDYVFTAVVSLHFPFHQALTFRQQRSPSPWWREVEPERQQLWPGRGRALFQAKPPTRTGLHLSWKIPLWLITRLKLLNQDSHCHHSTISSYTRVGCVSSCFPSLIWFGAYLVLPQRGDTWGRPCCSTWRSSIPASVPRVPTMPGRFCLAQSANVCVRLAHLGPTARNGLLTTLHVRDMYIDRFSGQPFCFCFFSCLTLCGSSDGTQDMDTSLIYNSSLSYLFHCTTHRAGSWERALRQP